MGLELGALLRCEPVSWFVEACGAVTKRWRTVLPGLATSRSIYWLLVNDASRYEKLLGSHIGFLERSSRHYDSGHEDESLVLSNSVRTIFHDKGRTTSLLSHLKLKGTQMLSTSRGIGDWRDYLSHVLNMNSSRPIIMKPLLGDSFTQVSMSDWWEGETIFIHEGTNYTRSRIILSVAQKDGGSHVDKQLESYYKVLCAGTDAIGITGTLTYNGPPPFPQGVTIYPDNAHLALVRQFAHETLASQSHFGWPVS